MIKKLYEEEINKVYRDYKVFAVDFDGTLCKSIWPEIGEPNLTLIEWIKEKRREGNKIILWTCREGKLLDEALAWCKDKGLEFDAVNDNTPELIKLFGNNPRKVSADYFIDDKNWKDIDFGLPYKSNETTKF